MTSSILYMCYFLGRHNCLWCHIVSGQLAVPPAARGQCRERTVETLRKDYEGFVAAGGDLKVAKLHNNVIGECILDIPLDNVKKLIIYAQSLILCILGLHTWLAYFLGDF